MAQGGLFLSWPFPTSSGCAKPRAALATRPVASERWRHTRRAGARGWQREWATGKTRGRRAASYGQELGNNRTIWTLSGTCRMVACMSSARPVASDHWSVTMAVAPNFLAAAWTASEPLVGRETERMPVVVVNTAGMRTMAGGGPAQRAPCSVIQAPGPDFARAFRSLSTPLR